MPDDSAPLRAAAVRYDPERETAPRLVAKGRGEVARRILELAEEHDIPLYRDPDMLELLMALDVDQEIPGELYTAMAEILAFIYRMNRKGPPV